MGATNDWDRLRLEAARQPGQAMGAAFDVLNASIMQAGFSYNPNNLPSDPRVVLHDLVQCSAVPEDAYVVYDGLHGIRDGVLSGIAPKREDALRFVNLAAVTAASLERIQPPTTSTT